MGRLPVRTIILALVFALAIAIGARALTVSVAEFRLVADPENLVEASFVLLNDEPRTVDVSLVVTDWDDNSDGVTVIHAVGTVSRSCGTWMTVDASSFSLGAFEERTIRIQARVPPDVRGTYWAGFLARIGSAAEATIAPTDVAVSSEALVRFFVTVPPAEEEAAVTELRVLSLEPFRVETRLSNTGDTRLCDVEGIVSLEGPSGQETSFSLPTVNVLPGHSLDVDMELPWQVDRSGLYLLRVVFDYGAETLIAGQIVVRVP